MENFILQNDADLKSKNYILEPGPTYGYWVQFYVKKLKERYLSRFGEDFNLILVGAEDVEDDYYIIPYAAIKDMLLDKYAYPKTRTKQAHWQMSIKGQHQLDVRNCPYQMDISRFYGNPDILHTPISAIENAKQVIQTDSDNARDARERIIAAITLRRGQPKFRRQLLDAYEGRCAITGCDAEAALEASHIIPYGGEHSNTLENGILLRADIHTLFDLNLITIDPTRMTVILAPELEDTVYSELKGLRLDARPEILKKIQPSLARKGTPVAINS